MGNVQRSVSRVRRTAVASVIAVTAVGMTGCGSSSPKSGGTATTVGAATTTATASTTAPKAAATTVPPTTTAAAPTTVPATKAPTGKDAKLAKRYEAIIGGANAAGNKFSKSLDGYQAGKVTPPRYKSALSSYIAASRRLQTALLAVRWKAPVEALTRRIVTQDRLLVTQLKALTTTPRAKLNAALVRVTKTLIGIHTLSDKVREDLGLPAAA